jgi:hypothetical protein
MNETLPEAAFSMPHGRVVLHGAFTARRDRRDEPRRAGDPADERFPRKGRGPVGPWGDPAPREDAPSDR